VGGSNRLDSFEGNGIERLGQYFQPFAHATQDRPQLARTCTLAVKCVVDEVYQQRVSTNFNLSLLFKLSGLQNNDKLKFVERTIT
jgi:hypothetical protein